MSIASDIRSYADTAVAQGKQVLDQAQSQLGEVTGTVTEIADKATAVVTDLRQQAEKAVNLDALTTAIEPYLAQVKEYTSVVTDKVTTSVDALLSTARKDPRVDKLVATAESIGAVVVETLNERVVKPVQSFTGLSKPASDVKVSKPAPKPTAAAKPARKPAATKPTSRPAGKTTARKPAAKPTTDS